VSGAVDRDEMVAERDFLLRSLDDLDAELVAGNIDPDTYRSLHDDYTARAADVVRALDKGATPASDPAAVRSSPLRRVLTAGGIVLFAVLVAFLLARATGERQPGQGITGNDQLRDPSVTQPTLDPDSYEARIRNARSLLGNQDFEAALREYTAAAKADPTQAEPLAYRGWISSLVARQVEDPDTRARLVERALEDLNAANKLAPEYLDPYFFKGYTLLNLADKPNQAVPALQRFLQLAPSDHPLREQVLGVLAEAQRAADAKP
jgi:tetratricopeptide (TPR) repeat protein